MGVRINAIFSMVILFKCPEQGSMEHSTGKWQKAANCITAVNITEKLLLIHSKPWASSLML